MKSALRLTRYIACNACVLGAIVAGFQYHIAGIQRIALFAVWMLFVGSLVLLNKEARKKSVKSFRGLPVPVWLDTLVEMVIIAALLWFGAVISAAAYTFQAVIAHGVVAEAREAKSAADPA